MFLVGENSQQSCEKQPGGTQTLPKGTQALPDFFNITVSGESQAHLSAGEFPLLWYLWDAVG